MEQVLYWNEVAIEANRLSFTNLQKGEIPEQGGPTLSSRALGIIHLAMHDAYKGISGTTKFDFYLSSALQPALPNLSGVDRQKASIASIAAAAYTTLVALYPKQKSFFDAKLNSITHILPFEKAYHYGCEIARVILELRKDDPNNSDKDYIPFLGRGYHKSDPDNPQGFFAPFYGNSKLFSATVRHDLSNQPFYVNGEFSSNDQQYKRASKQVRNKGIAFEQMGTLPSSADKRTNEESLVGVFWAYDGANKIGTPPRLYNQIVRIVAMNNHDLRGFANDTERNVRLFALVNVAMADAGILAWQQKYKHNLWRPVNGIREHDISMGVTGTGNFNFDDDCDPFWLPLGAPKSNSDGIKNFTPDFPAYPSGHATFGASALHITRLFFGVLNGDRNKDTLFQGFELVSDEFNGVTKDNNNTIRPLHKRKFEKGLWGMIIENALSRVYLGVHWSFDAFKTKNDNTTPELDKKIGGVDLGLKIAEDIFLNKMKMSNVGPANT
jgi:Vanadium chloroperoxidase N-terminal domain/PAP2 superfamily